VTAYLDASALVPTLVDEPASAIMVAFIEQCSVTLVVSEFATAEVASALSRLVRTDTMTADEATARLIAFDSWRSTASEPVDISASDMRLANTYARRFDLMLRAPDALHAAICSRLNLTLVTLDRRLAKAARELGIDVSAPAA
jgi:predicted nucleic acid-binding protein